MSRLLPPLPAQLPLGVDLQATLLQIDAFLRQTVQTRQAQASGEDCTALLETLQAHHRGLEGANIPARRDCESIDPTQARRAFAAGALRMMYYRQTVLSRRPLIDSAGSKTLAEYQPDLHTRSEHDAALWRVDVAKACQMSLNDIAEVEAAILPDEVHAVAQRKRIIDALVELLDIPGQPQQAAKQLLDACFPGSALRDDECNIICTAASIYLCLPYHDGRWTSRGPEQDDDPALMQFLDRISRPLQTTMAHFPAFAPINAADIDTDLLRQVADHCGQPVEAVRERLCTLITVLPTPKIDQFIIHDVWGHQWQAHLFQFEEAYARVAAMTVKPPISEATMEVVRALNRGDTEIARQRWSAFLSATLDANLLDSLTGLIAEVFADAIEHKFLVLHPERHELLLSSSFFKHLPTKLDLTLADLPLYFRMACRGVARLGQPKHLRPFREKLAQALPELSKAEIEAATQTLSSWTRELFEAPYWQRSLHLHSQDENLICNAFGLVALEFVRFQLAFNRAHAALSQRGGESHPLLPRFQDLLIFSVASFFELDRSGNFWRLADYIEDHFIPCYDALIDAGR